MQVKGVVFQLARTAARWAMIAWMVVFFCVITPGHQRGTIKAAGSADAVLAAPSCPLCSSLTLWGAPGSDDSQNTPAPTRPSPKNCAICMLIAKLDCVMWTPPRALMLERLPWFDSQSEGSPIVALISLEPFDRRGPPTA